MRRQLGNVGNQTLGGTGLSMAVVFGLLAGLLYLGCQSRSPAAVPGPKAAPDRPQAAPSEVKQQASIRTQERSMDQPQQASQQAVAAPQKVESAEAAALPVGPSVEAASPQAQTTKPKGPKIVFEKTEFDMGEISTNSKGRASFRLTNVGDGTLEITDVVKCCGANVELEKKKLEPGESSGLTVEYNTGGDAGQFRKQLIVHSNDQTHPAVTLTIMGKVAQRLIWKPTQLKLFLSKENLGCGDLVITALDGKPFSVKGYLSTGDCFTMDQDPNAQATEFVLKPKVNKEKLQALAYPKGMFQIMLTREDYNVLAVPFDLLPNYTSIPAQIIIFNVEPGKKESRKITVLDNYAGEGRKADFSIESVASQNQSVNVSTTEKIKDGFQLTVTINPPAPKEGERSFSDELHIKVKEGEELTVNIRLFYAAKVLSNAWPKTTP